MTDGGGAAGVNMAASSLDEIGTTQVSRNTSFSLLYVEDVHGDERESERAARSAGAELKESEK